MCSCTGSSGFFSRTISPQNILENGVKRYTIYVEAKDKTTDENNTLSGQFRVFGHQEKYFCSVNMINTGTKPIPLGGSIEYVSVGEHITEFHCWITHLPNYEMFNYTCKSRCNKIAA